MLIGSKGKSDYQDIQVTTQVEIEDPDGSGLTIGQATTNAAQPSCKLLHARLSYSFFDDRAQFVLWARNLTDKVYTNVVTPVVSSFGFIVKYYDAPRTFGAELSWEF